MKILHIISSGGMYGAEAVILNLSHSLNEAGNHSILGVFMNSENINVQLHERAVKDRIESYLIPCIGQIDWDVPKRIRALVMQTRADIVHAHGYKADIYVYGALRNSKIPLISTCHNWIDNSLLLSFYGMVDRFVLRQYPAVVAVSEEVKERLLRSGVYRDKVHLISNGIDLRPFEIAKRLPHNAFFTDGELIVGLVGRLSAEKGIDLFLKAAALVLRAVPNTRFVVVGEGPDHEKLNLMIAEMDLGKYVSLLGRRDDMASVYASLDVMVSASRREGLPMAILEGMASGRAIVATAVGEVPTAIRNGKTGLLVPAEHVDQLAAAIITMLQDATKRNSLGAAARQLVREEFSAQRMATDYLRLYENTRSKGFSDPKSILE